MPRGGRRPGAGRPPGRGPYGEPTANLRVPVSVRERLRRDLRDGIHSIPLFASKVAAGFPSPADDFVVSRIDANALAIDNPAATFFLRVHGDSMRDAGIFDGDYLAVDRSLEPHPGDIVVAAVSGEFTVKRYRLRNGQPVLQPENPDYPEIVPAPGEEFSMCGVVRAVVRRLVR